MKTIYQESNTDSKKDLSLIDRPLVSIGIPVYNGQRFIKGALESVCAQDYPNLEIIVSDNASTDNTLSICRQFAETDSRIKIHRQPENLGVLRNFSTLVELARGKYFMWAGVDDYWLPEFVSTLVDDLESHPSANLSMSGFKRVYEDGTVHDVQRFIKNNSPNGKSYLAMLLKLTSSHKFNLFIYGLFRTDFIRTAVNYFPNIPCWDRVFMCMLSLATPIRYVDKILHIHTLNSKSLKERYPEEKVFKQGNSKKFRFLFFKTIYTLFCSITKSGLIPWYRKFYLIIGLPHYAIQIVKHRIQKLLRVVRKPVKEMIRSMITGIDQKISDLSGKSFFIIYLYKAEKRIIVCILYAGKLFSKIFLTHKKNYNC